MLTGVYIYIDSVVVAEHFIPVPNILVIPESGSDP